MKAELSYIDLAGKSMPMKLNNIVLQDIQEKYGTVNQFELLLLGAEKKIENEKTIIKRTKEPSIEVINYVLPKMILEGLEIIESDEKYTEKDLIRMIDMDFDCISELIHAELKKCFEKKK